MLILKTSYGLHSGLVVAFDDDLARALRQREKYGGYAVAAAKSYEDARGYLLECASWAKRTNRIRKREG